MTSKCSELSRYVDLSALIHCLVPCRRTDGLDCCVSHQLLRRPLSQCGDLFPPLDICFVFILLPFLIYEGLSLVLLHKEHMKGTQTPVALSAIWLSLLLLEALRLRSLLLHDEVDSFFCFCPTLSAFVGRRFFFELHNAVTPGLTVALMHVRDISGNCSQVLS